MPQNDTKYIRWTVPEYRRPNRDRRWYLVAGLIALICLFFSFFSISQWHIIFLGAGSNFLFVLIIIVAAIITIFNENQPTVMVDVELGPEGIRVGQKFYDYDDLKNFCVLYKPKMSIKNLYFEYKNTMRPRLSLPLRRLDALSVRNFLIRYLDEDLERANPPLSEQLTKLLKL